MELKDIIKTRRDELGLTMQDIADYVGVSKPTIQRYESGEIVNLKQGMIYKLSQVLRISPAKLMGWENPDEAVSSILHNRINEIGITLDAVAEKTGVPLTWMQNIDTFVPGDWGGENDICYTWITRVAEAIGLPGSTLRTALARQEVPVYDGGSNNSLEQSRDDFKDLVVTDYIPEKIRAVARDLMDLPEDKRDIAINLINMMSQKGKEAKEK